MVLLLIIWIGTGIFLHLIIDTECFPKPFVRNFCSYSKHLSAKHLRHESYQILFLLATTNAKTLSLLAAEKASTKRSKATEMFPRPGNNSYKNKIHWKEVNF